MADGDAVFSIASPGLDTMVTVAVELAVTGPAGLDEDLEAGIRRYDGPVLVLRMADDDYAPETAVRAVSDRFAAADVDLRVLDADMLGDRADHFRWARRPDAVTAAILSWLRAPRSAA